MVEPWDDFRRFEEMMNRMFENFWGRPTSRRLLPSGERGAIVPAAVSYTHLTLPTTPYV